MTVYEEYLNELQETARNALDVIAGAPIHARDTYDESTDRLETVLGYVVVLLGGAAPDLVPESVRTGLTLQLQLVANCEPPPPEARMWADAILELATRIPLAREHDLAQQAREGAASYQRSIQQRLASLSTEFLTAQREISALVASGEAKATELATEIDQLGTNFQATLNDYAATIANEEARLEQLKTSEAETFREAQNSRDVDYQGTMSEFRADLDVLLADSGLEVETRVAEIRRMEKESAGLVGAIGLAGTAERYGEEVKAQCQAANVWRRVTVVLAALAAVAVTVVAISLAHDATWEEFTGKLAASLLLGGLAAYTARQSADHRSRERDARRLQLELTAFGPFIEPLSPEQQEEERVIMTRKTFGRPVSESIVDEPGPHPLSLMMRRKQRELDGTP
jgi:hypothetical protein